MSREVENYRNGFFLTHHFLYIKNLFGPRQAATCLVNIVNLTIIIILFNNNTLYQIFFIILLTYQFHHV